MCVSIHAPTRGATSHSLSGRTRAKRFNPRTHTGCDSPEVTIIVERPSFNPRTHTGCDVQVLCSPHSSQRFNPRTHTGCDPLYLQDFECTFLFQSTHPHGVRRSLCNRPDGLICFNPRTHTGCDSTEITLRALSNVSIHAPTRGATVAF